MFYYQFYKSFRKRCFFVWKMLFRLQNRSQFSQDIWRNVNYVREINVISWGTLIKAFYLPKNLRHRFVDENDNAKTNSNIPSAFLLFKSIAFFKVLITSVFSIVNVWHAFTYFFFFSWTKEHRLKTLIKNI